MTHTYYTVALLVCSSMAVRFFRSTYCNYAQYTCSCASCNVQGRGLLGSDLVREKLFGLGNPEPFEEKKSNIIFYFDLATCTVYV